MQWNGSTSALSWFYLSQRHYKRTECRTKTCTIFPVSNLFVKICHRHTSKQVRGRDRRIADLNARIAALEALGHAGKGHARDPRVTPKHLSKTRSDLCRASVAPHPRFQRNIAPTRDIAAPRAHTCRARPENHACN